MDISLSPHIEKFLQAQIAAGIYDTINDAINANLNIIISNINMPMEQIEQLNQEIQKGIDDYNAGRFQDGETAFKKLMMKYE